MSYEIIKQVRTHDGVVHENVEAAKAHMRDKLFQTLGDCEEYMFQQAATDRDPKYDAIRSAVRDAYLLMWPRANTGKPRGPRKAKEVEPETAPLPMSEDTPGERAVPKRNGKKAA